MCNNCNKACPSIVSDACVMYTGPAIESLGINSGDSVASVLVTLFNQLDEVVGAEALELSDKVNNLSSEDIKSNSSLYRIASATSVYSAAITNKGFGYNISQLTTQAQVEYDLTEFARDLPKDYTLLRVSSELRGTQVLATSRGTSAQLTAKHLQLPATLTINALVATPGGDVELTRAVPVTSGMRGNFSSTLKANDAGQEPTNLTQREYNENLASVISGIKQELDSLTSKQLDVKVSLQESKIADSVSLVTGNQDNITSRLSELETSLENLNKNFTLIDQKIRSLRTIIDGIL